MTKKRRPMNVADNFQAKLKEVQEKFRRENGKEISMRDITEDIVKWDQFEEFERKLLNGDVNFNIKIKMDSRRGK